MKQRNFFSSRNGRRGRFYFIVLILFGVFFTAGFLIGSQKTQEAGFKPQQISAKKTQPPPGVEVDFSSFWDVWQRVTTEHLDRARIDPKKLVEGAIAGLVAAVGDPYSVYLTPEQNEQTKQELAGVYEGVGIQLGVRNEKIVVIAPLAGTPAAAAGVRAGDVILQIDDRLTLGLSLPEAVSLIRGGAGTKVKLVLQRNEGQPFEKELQRAKITVKSVELNFEGLEGEKVAVLKLSSFGETTNSEWDEAVGKILEEKAQGLILDLRNNPGGFLQGAVYIASEFTNGRIVGQQKNTGDVEFFSSKRPGKLTKIPVVVLINGGTASAAEIVAGALQEKKKAKLVGETSFGKGTVQDVQDLEGGAGLHLTIAKWLLPSGKDINEGGLKPDIEVVEDEDLATDLQLEKAKEILKSML